MTLDVAIVVERLRMWEGTALLGLDGGRVGGKDVEGREDIYRYMEGVLKLQPYPLNSH